MSDPTVNTLDHVITLEGESNWAMWKVSLKSELSFYDNGLWDIITGKEVRPGGFSSQASSATDVETESSTIHLSSMSTDTQDAVTTSDMEKVQVGWDHRDRLALTCIQSTVHSYIARVVNLADRTYAYEAFESLRKICEGNPPFTAYTTAVRWLTYKYDVDQNPQEFIINWSQYLADMKAAHPIKPVSELLCCHVFLAAVDNNPACSSWLHTFSYDEGIYTDTNLRKLFDRFYHSELGRIQLQEQREALEEEQGEQQGEQQDEQQGEQQDE